MERLYTEEKLLREIVDSTTDAFVVTDSNSIVREWNIKAEMLFGWSPDEAIGRPITETIIPEPDRRDYECRIKKFDPSCPSVLHKRESVRAVGKDGREVFIEVTEVPVAIGDNFFFVSLIRDTKEEKVLESELMRRASLLNLSRDGIYVINRDHKIVLWTKGSERMYGYTESEAMGAVPYELLHSVYDMGNMTFFDVLKTLTSTDKWEGEIHQTTKDGKEIIVLSRWAIDRKSQEMLVTNTDITDLRHSIDRAEFLTTHDELTGLPNRRLVSDRIEHAITMAQANGCKFAVMMLDVDRFKIINDSLGHHQGDILLKEVATRLCESIRSEDTVGRVGGDEFILLVENMKSVDDIVAATENILHGVSKPCILGQNEVSIDASIGVSVYPDDAGDCQTLTRHADLAMYRAKDVNKGSYRFYSSEMNEAVQNRIQDEYRLRNALEKGEFELYYQPKICSVENRTTGAEALIRWNCPGRGLVSPSEFIPLAEEIGLIGPIGTWAMREACKQNKEWQDSGLHPIKMSVNLSIYQLSHDTADLIGEILRDTGLDPCWLDIEITESAAMENVETTIDILQRVRDLGVSLSIDDFGTGFSSLSHLKKMPIDNLKIDQSFVRGIPVDNDDICIVRSIIAMAHSMGMKVIAEGVTDTEQVAFLDTMQCDEMQGYLFSQPVTAEKMLHDGIIGKFWAFPYEVITKKTSRKTI